MAYTHDYKLEIGDTTFKGDIEINNAGVVGYNETSNDKMSARITGAVKIVLEELSKLPENYSDLKTFKVSII
jgi:hypothetical protein